MTRGALLACCALLGACSTDPFATRATADAGAGGATGAAGASIGGAGGSAHTGGNASGGGTMDAGAAEGSSGGSPGAGGAPLEDGAAYADGAPKCSPGLILCQFGSRYACTDNMIPERGCSATCVATPCQALPTTWLANYARPICSGVGACDYECPDGWAKDATVGCVNPCSGLSYSIACGGTQFWTGSGAPPNTCSICPPCPVNIHCCLSTGGCGCATGFPNYGGCQ